MTILDIQDRGRTVDVEIQSLFTVLLEENPSTGYVWKVETAEGLKMVDNSFERGSEAIGAAGMRTFQFRASKAGSYNLSIKKWREWEGESSIIDRFHAVIVVK